MHRETGDAEPRVREEESKWERERGGKRAKQRERERVEQGRDGERGRNSPARADSKKDEMPAIF